MSSSAPEKHARFSPSAAERNILCAASLAMNERVPNRETSHSQKGTAAHELAALTLATEHRMCDDLINRRASKVDVRFDEDMCEATQRYVDSIGEYAEGHTLFIEQQVDFSNVVGIPDQFGTGDAIIITNDLCELQIHDLKSGYKRVAAKQNPQLMTYALGAIHQYHLGPTIERVRLVIHQPQHKSISEWTCGIDELRAFGAKLKAAAVRSIALADSKEPLPLDAFTPGEKQCQWCNAQAMCPAATEKAMRTVIDKFDNLDEETPTTLKIKIVEATGELINTDAERTSILLANVDFIESWCKAVRSHASAELLEGREVPGFKLVQGREGDRKWADEDEAEIRLKAMRLKVDEMYTQKVISPTKAEKVLKKRPRLWKTLQKLIKREPGGIHVAPLDDPREAYVIAPVSESFDDLTGEIEDLL